MLNVYFLIFCLEILQALASSYLKQKKYNYNYKFVSNQVGVVMGVATDLL